MSKKASNSSLHKAKTGKNDEFYTQLPYIEKELGYYKDHFRDKIVFCNCDDPQESNFYFYFAQNFEFLGLKKLITTHYETNKPSYKLEIIADINADGKINKLDTIQTPLKQNGDFRSPECIEILQEADIIVTNPPFSLFREYIGQLMEYNKNFIIIGNYNAVTYKEIFPLIKENKIWLGVSLDGRNVWFRIPNEYEKYHKIENGVKYAFVASTVRYTNLEHSKRHEELVLYKIYNPQDYPKYDNYDAIEVSKVSNIPVDYPGVMGVPITFLNKYNPDQFEIVGATESEGKGFSNGLWLEESKTAQPVVNGERVYKRLFIKNKQL